MVEKQLVKSIEVDGQHSCTIFVLTFRENAIRLEEKEKKEKELLSQIIDEADEYKVDFYQRQKVACENNKANNREKEKVRVDVSLYTYI